MHRQQMVVSEIKIHIYIFSLQIQWFLCFSMLLPKVFHISKEILQRILLLNHMLEGLALLHLG